LETSIASKIFLVSQNHLLVYYPIYVIDGQNIQPYKSFIGKLKRVNNLRKDSAHTGLLIKAEAEEIRSILFEENLLNLLSILKAKLSSWF